MRPLLPFSLLLLTLFSSASQAATTDLLQPAWQQAWQFTTDSEIPIKSVVAKETNWLTISRPGALFNPVIMATHFGKNGPFPPGAKTPPEVTLKNVGDTIGVRLLVTYNTEACVNLGGNFLRVALGNSRGTRQAGSLWDIKDEVFRDDTGWCLHFGQGKVATSLFHRPPVVDEKFNANILTTLLSGRKIMSWPSPPPVGLIKPNQPAEVIFSLTRSGPAELKVYGFIASHEVEHTATEVTDFSFDTVYFHYPNGNAEPGASVTFREFQLITP